MRRGYLLGAALGLGIAFPALAEEAPTKVPPPEYTLRLKPAEVVIIGQALGQLKYSDVAALIANIQGQMAAEYVDPPPVKLEAK